MCGLSLLGVDSWSCYSQLLLPLHATTTTDNHTQVKWNKKTVTRLSDTLKWKLWTWCRASQCAIAPLHAHAVLRFLSWCGAHNPWSEKNKVCLLFVSLSGKNEMKKKTNKHWSSPVWYGEARRLSLGLAIRQELAQIILLSKYFPQELQFLGWICKTQPTATQWRQDGKSAAAATAQRAAAQSTPQSVQARLFDRAQAHVLVRQGGVPGRQRKAGVHEKWASLRCILMVCCCRTIVVVKRTNTHTDDTFGSCHWST